MSVVVIELGIRLRIRWCGFGIRRVGFAEPRHSVGGERSQRGAVRRLEIPADAQRAVRAGLEIVASLHHLNTPRQRLLQVRIGIHTGLVVIGEIGSSEKREILALGETPNLAARVQGVAAPDTVVMSAVTQRLVQGLFECQDLGPQVLKGIAAPVSVYRVLVESTAQSRFEVTVQTGLTPLAGREYELGVLRERWTQAQTGEGQVVLLSGEAGIGESRLVQELKD